MTSSAHQVYGPPYFNMVGTLLPTLIGCFIATPGADYGVAFPVTTNSSTPEPVSFSLVTSSGATKPSSWSAVLESVQVWDCAPPPPPPNQVTPTITSSVNGTAIATVSAGVSSPLSLPASPLLAAVLVTSVPVSPQVGVTKQCTLFKGLGWGKRLSPSTMNLIVYDSWVSSPSPLMRSDDSQPTNSVALSFSGALSGINITGQQTGTTIVITETVRASEGLVPHYLNWLV